MGHGCSSETCWRVLIPVSLQRQHVSLQVRSKAPGCFHHGFLRPSFSRYQMDRSEGLTDPVRGIRIGYP